LKKVYLDYAATTPVDKQVLKSMMPYFSKEYGNPSSIYDIGLKTKNAITDAREKIAKLINGKSTEIIFTGSGTESDNLAILGIAKANKKAGNHIVTTSIEHPAVMETVKSLEKEGFKITYLPVDKYGSIGLESLKREITDKTILISIMYANNEIGTIEPIEEIGKYLKAENEKRALKKLNRIYFHSDACQAAGFYELNIEKLGLDLLTINGSKIYGPKGTGFLYVRSGTVIEPVIYGGKQEFKLRSGTENVPGIIGLAKAFEIAQENNDKSAESLKELQTYFIEQIKEKIPKVIFNGNPKNKLPNNINVTILDAEGESMILYLDQKGIYCSTGSACSMNELKSSHVLKAIGLKDEAIHGSLRFTIGKFTTKKDIDYTVYHLSDIISKLRKMSPVNIPIDQARKDRLKNVGCDN
jgi:cysteine desulfurase